MLSFLKIMLFSFFLALASSAISEGKTSGLKLESQTKATKSARVLHLDDPLSNLYVSLDNSLKSKIASDEKNPISLQQISKIVNEVVENKKIDISSRAQDSDSIDYHLSTKSGRDLSLLVNDEKDKIRLKLSVDESSFDKQASVSQSGEVASEIHKFLDESLDSAVKETKGRILIDQNHFSEIGKSLAEIAVEFGLQAQQDKGQFTIRSKTNPNKILGSMHIANYDNENYLETSNDGIADFEDGHSYFAKKISDLSDMEAVKHLIKAAVNQFVRDSAFLQQQRGTTAQDAYTQIYDFIKSKKVYKLHTRKSDFGAVVILGVPEPELGIDRVQCLVYPTQTNSIGIQFLTYDREFHTVIELVNFPETFELFKSELNERMKRPANYRSFAEIRSDIAKTIKDDGMCKDFQGFEEVGVRLNVWTTTFAGGKQVSSSGKACSMLLDSMVLYEYNFGFMHYIHMIIDNEFFRSEEFFSPAHVSTNNAHIDSISKNIRRVKQAVADMSKPTPAQAMITFDEIEKILPQFTFAKSTTNSNGVKGKLGDKFAVALNQLKGGVFDVTFSAFTTKGSITTEHVISDVLVQQNSGDEGLSKIKEAQMQLTPINHV